MVKKYPHTLSGGQRQRVVLARALALRPKLIIADEPVSMLDVSIRAEMLELMQELQKKYSISFIYITHDLATARYFGQRIGILYLGKIVEMGPINQVLTNPKHPYTQALIDAMPNAIAARAELDKLAKTYEADIRSMGTEYQNKVKQYDAEASTKTQEENQKRMQEVAEIEQSIRQFQTQAQQDIQKKEQELFTPIYKEAKDAIQKVGRAQGFNYILDSREGQGTILMAEGKDLLADVKKELGF